MSAAERFERLCESLPPLDLNWEYSDPEVPEVDGSPVSSERLCESLPPVQIDWMQSPTLVITLHLRPEADSVDVYGAIADVILNAVEFDLASGGVGLRREENNERLQVGVLTLKLVPLATSPESTDRLEQVARRVREAIPSNGAISSLSTSVDRAA